MEEPGFLFVGAGEASYFEWAELFVCFVRTPSTAEVKAIGKRVPPPLRDTIKWNGPLLWVASEQGVGRLISAAYAKQPKPPTKLTTRSKHKIAPSSATARFNVDIDDWLAFAHSVAAIRVAYRHEDAEAGGTQLSSLHYSSVKKLPGVIAVLASSTEPAIGKFAQRLTAAFPSLETSVAVCIAHLKRLKRRSAELLRPGLSRAQITTLASELPVKPCAELVALYSMHDGTTSPPKATLDALALFPGYHWLTFEEAIAERASRLQLRDWKKTWLPVFADGAGGYYVVDNKTGEVVNYLLGEDEQVVEYESLATMFATLAECFAEKAFFVKSKQLEVDDDAHALIARRYNPDVATWAEDQDDDQDARVRNEAIALAERAFKLHSEKRTKASAFEALALYEQAVVCDDLPSWIYVNTLWAVQADNNGRPVDEKRARRLLVACMSQAHQHGDLYVNAAFVNAEVGDDKEVLRCLLAARKKGINLKPHLKTKTLAKFSDHPRLR